MKTLYAFGLLALLAVNGCAALIIADAIDSSAARTQRQQFVYNFNQVNMIRRGQGLPALDWCSECYRYDRAWAMKDKMCKARVKRYEKGDSVALEPPGSVRAGSVPDSIAPDPNKKREKDSHELPNSY